MWRISGNVDRRGPRPMAVYLIPHINNHRPPPPSPPNYHHHQSPAIRKMLMFGQKKMLVTWPWLSVCRCVGWPKLREGGGTNRQVTCSARTTSARSTCGKAALLTCVVTSRWLTSSGNIALSIAFNYQDVYNQDALVYISESSDVTNRYLPWADMHGGVYTGTGYTILSKSPSDCHQ